MTLAASSTTWLTAAEWLAVLRIGLGLWWFESFRHKDKAAWFQRGAGISWGQSVAEKHKWAFVKKGFDVVVVPRPKVMAYVVVLGELAIGLGLILGLLDAHRRLRRDPPQPLVLHPHDLGLGRAGAELHDGSGLGGGPGDPRLEHVVASTTGCTSSGRERRVRDGFDSRRRQWTGGRDDG